MAAVVSLEAMNSVPDIAIAPGDDIAVAQPGEGVGLLPDLPIIPPTEAPDTANWIRCVAAAVFLHAVVLIGLNWPVPDNALGGGGTDLEAISVDVVEASALETAIDPKPTGAAASTSRLAEREGSDREQQASADAADRMPEPRPEAAAPAATADLVIPDFEVKPEPPAADVPAVAIAPVKAEQVSDATEPRVEADMQPKPAAAATASAPSEAAAAEQLGGAATRSTSAVDMAAPSAAVAITGELGAYARLVQQTVAKAPPRVSSGVGARGSVVINFALGLDGSLLRAQVLTSSGNPTLDEAALAAVRRAKFPPPPAGSQLAQLIYNFPVRYR